MAIRLRDNKLETPATSVFNGARKFFVSCRLRIASTSDPKSGGSIISRSSTSTFTIDVQGGWMFDGKRMGYIRMAVPGWTAIEVRYIIGMPNHIVLVYDADDPAVQGCFVNGLFKATTTPTSIPVPNANAGIRLQAGTTGDYAVEELVIGKGVIPTAAQRRRLGNLTADHDDSGIIAELLAAPGASVHRWTLRGEEGAPAGGPGDPGVTASGSSSLKFNVLTGTATYADNLHPATPVFFGQPTIMSSGRAVDIPLFVETDVGLVPAAAVSRQTDLKPTFRVNGGPPIEAEYVLGSEENYDAMLCLLPPGTVIGPDDVVTWSAPDSWVATTSGASSEIVDAPCRNRVGKTSFDNPEETPPMRVGFNITQPGPTYYTQYQFQANRALQMNHGNAGGDLSKRRWPDGTLNTPSGGILFASVGTVDKTGYPTQLGRWYLAWTDHGPKGENGEKPCEFSIGGGGYNPKVVKVAGMDRDEVLPDGAVRKVRVYEFSRHREPVTLTANIDASATTIPISGFGAIGSPSTAFDIVLELDGETITASGRTTNPNQLTNCVRGVKGTAQAHASGATGFLSVTQWGGTPTMTLTGTAGKVHYSDLLLLCPEDWTQPAEGEPTPLLYGDPLDFSAEFQRWTSKGAGVLRAMDSTPVGDLVLEPEHVRDPNDAMWSLWQDTTKAVITSVRQFTGGAGKWVYLRHPAPNAQTYKVNLLAPLEAVPAGTKQTIEVEGVESAPVMFGTRLLDGGETIRVISGAGTTWLVERGAGLTTPVAHAAGPIDAGWRFPLAQVVAPPPEGGGEDEEEEGGPGHGDGEEEPPPQGAGEAIHFEFVTTEPHSISTARGYSTVNEASRTLDVNIQSRRTGTLTADITAEDLTLHVNFAEEDWPWIAPGMQFLIGNEVMRVASVNRAAGTVEIEVPEDPKKPPRTNAAPRAAGTTITTRSNGLLCESADGRARAWQGVIDYAYQLCVTGPNSFYVNRAPQTWTNCTRVVPGQQLDNLIYRVNLPSRAYPYELLTKAAEHCGAWLIANVPGYATDDYAIAEARRLLASSKPGKTKFLIELANEIWNPTYPYYEPYDRFAIWGGVGRGPDYAVRRSWHVFNLFKKIFDEAGRGDELIHYMPWQAGQAGYLLTRAKLAGVPIHAIGCGPYHTPKGTADYIGFVNAADDDGPLCDAWAFDLARYVGASSLRKKLELDARNVASYESETGISVHVVHYEGGMEHTIPPSLDVVQGVARNRDVRYHPNWYFTERDFYSLIAKQSRGAAIAVFNNSQPPYDPKSTRNPGEYLWGMNVWWGQRAGYGDGRNGGIDNRLNLFRQGLPNSKTAVDNGDMKESVRWQAMIDYNRAFFSGLEPDEPEEPEEPGSGPGGDPKSRRPLKFFMGGDFSCSRRARGRRIGASRSR